MTCLSSREPWCVSPFSLSSHPLTRSRLQDALESRNSIYHSAISFMNAFAHAGTTSDQFLRDNLEWLGKASNWSKFTTTAALGVIHKGNLAQGKAILEPYLPSTNGGAGAAQKSVYSEGGSLYALGLVNANHGKEETTSYLVEQLKGSQEEVIQHGAALGLGVAAMGSGNEGASLQFLSRVFLLLAPFGRSSVLGCFAMSRD